MTHTLGHPSRPPDRVSSAAVTTPMPLSAVLAWWGTAWLRGAVVPDLVLGIAPGYDLAPFAIARFAA